MNPTDISGKSLLQRLLDYRNRAEELRIIADRMHTEPGHFMRSVATGLDQAADTVEAILRQSADSAI